MHIKKQSKVAYMSENSHMILSYWGTFYETYEYYEIYENYDIRGIKFVKINFLRFNYAEHLL